MWKKQKAKRKQEMCSYVQNVQEEKKEKRTI